MGGCPGIGVPAEISGDEEQREGATGLHHRGHEMFNDDMIMYVIINDQQSFMATINISSA